MSRLRRLVLSDRFFFIACRLLRRRRMLGEGEFECLARVVGERRETHRFLLTAWVFLPDHWHAILYPRFPLTPSRVMESIKVASTLRLNAGRKESGLLWPPRFFDRALPSVKEYWEGGVYSSEPGEGGLGEAGRGLAMVECAGVPGDGSSGRDPAPRFWLSTECCCRPMNGHAFEEKPQSLWKATLCATSLLPSPLAKPPHQRYRADRGLGHH